MGGKAYINPAQRKVSPLRLKLLLTGGRTINGVFKVRNQIERLASEGKIRVLVTRKYLAATFDEKEILNLEGSADYARLLARAGVSEILFEKGTDSVSVGHVLNVLVTRGVRASRRILAKNSMLLKVQDKGQKIPEEIPDCLQIKAEDFIIKLASEKFLKLEKPDVNDAELILGRILNYHLSEGFPKNFVPKLSESQRVVIENLIIKSLFSGDYTYRPIAKYFLSHPKISAQYLLALISFGHFNDLQSSINFLKRDYVTTGQKFGVLLAAVRNMKINNPKPIFHFLNEHIGATPYIENEFRRFINDIITAMAGSKGISRLKADEIMHLAEIYDLPRDEFTTHIMEMVGNGKLVGEDALLVAENGFVPTSMIADIIRRHLPKSEVRVEVTTTVTPGRWEIQTIKEDDVGMFLREENVYVKEKVTREENIIENYSERDYQRAARIITKQPEAKQAEILNRLPDELSTKISEFIING